MSGTGDPTEIREGIAATREQPGETVEPLAAKTDVAGNTRRKLKEAGSEPPKLAPAAVLAARARGCLITWRRARRRRASSTRDA